jgi:hypothetical protein
VPWVYVLIAVQIYKGFLILQNNFHPKFHF